MVTYTATPLDISAQLANPKIGAILHVGQPSVTVVGVGELLFGKTSPAGRTVQTIYPGSYADEVDFATHTRALLSLPCSAVLSCARL